VLSCTGKATNATGATFSDFFLDYSSQVPCWDVTADRQQILYKHFLFFKAIAYTISDLNKAVFKISHCINFGME
jgi:hypothetical protein